MEASLNEFLTYGIFAFMLTFVRLGTASMLLPGVGDSFVPTRIRLLLALALSFAFFPLVIDEMPKPMPQTIPLFIMIGMEFIVGALIGTMARIFMMALDTAGMVISLSSGLANAQVFNPSLATQGSLVGAFITVTGIVLFFSTGLYHLVIMGVVNSYDLFPLGAVPDTGGMAEIIARSVSHSFLIGIQIGTPFIIITLLLYTLMGVLTRLMPQVQVFLLALPLQILLAIISLFLVLGAGYLYWATQFEQAMVFFLSQAPGREGTP